MTYLSYFWTLNASFGPAEAWPLSFASIAEMSAETESEVLPR